jgi:hypothetical protein
MNFPISTFLFARIAVQSLVLICLSACVPKKEEPCEITCDCGYVVNDYCDCELEAQCGNDSIWSTSDCECTAVPTFKADISNNITLESYHFESEGVNGVDVIFYGDTVDIFAEEGANYFRLVLVESSGADITVGTYEINDVYSYGEVRIERLNDFEMIMYGNLGSITITEIDQAAQLIKANMNFPVGDFIASTYCGLSNGVLDYWE